MKGFLINSNITTRLKVHASSKTHISMNEKWKNRTLLDACQKSVKTAIDSQHEIEIKKRRSYLKTIIKSILFLAKQDIALRGHDESIHSKNKGNFLELIDFISELNPEFKSFKENSTFNYLQHDIQNELIDILANKLIKQLLPPNFFSVIMDETMDIGRIEQIAFGLRHVTDELVIHE